MATNIKPLTMAFACLFCTTALAADAITGVERPLYEFQHGVKTEVTFGSHKVPARSKTDLAQIAGEGVICKLWITLRPMDLAEANARGRTLVINVYWEDSETPAISAPLADFFNQALQLQHTNNEFFRSSNEWSTFCSYLPMPFRKSARIEIVNDSASDEVVWLQTNVNYQKLSDDALYLHSHWRRQTKVARDHTTTVLPIVRGRGRYLGTCWAVRYEDALPNWYTRPVRFFIDDHSESDAGPSRAASIHVNLVKAIDDYLGSAWWSSEGVRSKPYSLPYSGRPFVHVNDADQRLSVVFYRYHVKDAIWFNESISMQVGGQNSKRQETGLSDWSSVAYFYLDKPQNELPKIQDFEMRTLGFEKPN